MTIFRKGNGGTQVTKASPQDTLPIVTTADIEFVKQSIAEARGEMMSSVTNVGENLSRTVASLEDRIRTIEKKIDEMPSFIMAKSVAVTPQVVSPRVKTQPKKDVEAESFVKSVPAGYYMVNTIAAAARMSPVTIRGKFANEGVPFVRIKNNSYGLGYNVYYSLLDDVRFLVGTRRLSTKPKKSCKKKGASKGASVGPIVFPKNTTDVISLQEANAALGRYRSHPTLYVWTNIGRIRYARKVNPKTGLLSKFVSLGEVKRAIHENPVVVRGVISDPSLF
jgi:hypothetical protein